DPTLPEGAVALAQFVQGPPELARRLAQIGVVERADGPRLAQMLKAGQRLVSREGDLWRWDGFTVAAHAPTGAARRLAERGRLLAIQSELVIAQSEVDAKRQAVATAEAALTAAAAAESQARAAARDAQRATDTAREDHAAAEREISRNAARISALTEAQARTAVSRDEAIVARDEADSALVTLAPAADIEAKLTAINEVIAGERSTCAEMRVEAQAIAREAELADRRLQAIAAERAEWSERRDGAAAQIATVGERSVEAENERSELQTAPQKFAEMRQSLIGEIETATAERRVAADRLAEAENELAEADKVARAAVGEARALAARGEERRDAAKRRLSDIEHEIREAFDIEPPAAAELAEIKPGSELPTSAEVEEKLDRIRRERERLGAVNLRAEQELEEVETQHQKLVG